MKRVSVIVPTFREGERLTDCLQALRNQTCPSSQFEVIVIDNTPEFELRGAGFHEARLLHEPRPGPYAARNRGIAEARGEALAFTDADCLPNPTWIEEGLDALTSYPEGALIAGEIEVFAHNPDRPTAAELFEIGHAFPQEHYARDRQFGATANVFVTRDVIETVGSFDGALISGGDSEFGRRVHDAGFPIVYAERAVVRHPGRRTLKELFSKMRRDVRGARDLERAAQLPRGTFVSGFFHDLRPPVQTCWRLLRDPHLGGGLSGIKAAGVMVLWRYYRAGYRLWLLLGDLNGRTDRF